MTILLTGASGFLGLNLTEALLARGKTVVAFGLEALPRIARDAFVALPGRLIEVQGDVLDDAALARVFAAHPIERIWHGAAITAGPDRERRDARRVLEVNLLGTLAMLEAAARAGVKRFVYPSSSSVYGETALEGDGAFDEEARAQPLALYGISKTAAEMLVLRARTVYGIDTLAGRINAVFGPWERDTGLRDTLSPMLQMLNHARAGRPVVLATGAERDWVYAPDVAQAFVNLLFTDSAPHCVYNISQGALWNARVFAEALARRDSSFTFRVSDDPGAVTLDYAGPVDRARRVMAIDRFTRDLGWWPTYSPQAACEHLVEWALRYPSWS